ncbi:hypothetical protein RFI_18932 [Reticulomyxa filosa]|uniref:ADP-ribosylhydrolase ARH3 n=1 Tax=Reticulomyxa filosa TaxID=46433 RepID=X6MWH2_RETFI|nr:hypothetical protein RFI_18932 [Reticulomyxa filosa]|eukprot:ETO18343.1 hypothetical protein RFI_18932 [Reticulomyxa filosa]
MTNKCDKEFDMDELISLCIEQMKTREMKQNLEYIRNQLRHLSTKEPPLSGESIDKEDIAFLSDIGRPLTSASKSSTNSTSTKSQSLSSRVNLLLFQIKAIDAVPLVMYCLGRWFRYPERCIINTVSLGGDTDTTASMVGGILGALHGTSWIPNRWFLNLENTKTWDQQTQTWVLFGRDLVLQLGQDLACLDCRTHSIFPGRLQSN